MKKTLFLIAAFFAVSLSNVTVSAQKAFTPISKVTYDYYDGFFDKFFERNTDACFLVEQSVIGPDFLVSVVLKNGAVKVRTNEKEYSMQCGRELYKTLKLLAKHAVLTASFSNKYQGFDGTSYFLFCNFDGVECWSPTGICEKAVNVFLEVGHAVMANDRERLEKQAIAADSLYHVFKTYYLEDYPVINVSVSIPSAPESGRKLEMYSVDDGFGLPVSSFSVVFIFPGNSFREEYRKQYLERYESTLKKVAYWIYAQSDFADNSNGATFIVDESVKKPIVTKSDLGDSHIYEIRLKASDLTAKKMISLLR